MKNKEFKKILLKAAFSVMACDGEIHQDEVTEIKKMIKETLYFDGLNYEEELNQSLKELKSKGGQAIEDFFTIVEEAKLNNRQELQLIEVLVKVVEADNKVEESELHFLHKIKNSINLKEEELIIKFPTHVNLLIDIGHYGNKEVRIGLQNIDMSNMDDLFNIN